MPSRLEVQPPTEELCRRCNDYPCACYDNHDEEFGFDSNLSCYECGGRGWIVHCPEDLCHGGDICIHGDPPSPCRNCNAKGEREDNH